MEVYAGMNDVHLMTQSRALLVKEVLIHPRYAPEESFIADVCFLLLDQVW